MKNETSSAGPQFTDRSTELGLSSGMGKTYGEVEIASFIDSSPLHTSKIEKSEENGDEDPEEIDWIETVYREDILNNPEYNCPEEPELNTLINLVKGLAELPSVAGFGFMKYEQVTLVTVITTKLQSEDLDTYNQARGVVDNFHNAMSELDPLHQRFPSGFSYLGDAKFEDIAERLSMNEQNKLYDQYSEHEEKIKDGIDVEPYSIGESIHSLMTLGRGRLVEEPQLVKFE